MPKIKRTLKEADILKACQDLLDAEKIPWYRMNSGKIILRNSNGSRRCIKLNPEGTPDLLCHVDKGIDFQCGEVVVNNKKVVWLETKQSGKHPTREQLAFADAARDRGETWLLIDDVKQLQDWLKEHRNG